MKTVNRICQILAVLFGLASLVLFFTKFVTITTNGNTVGLVGAQLAFGSKVEVAGAEYDMARSARVLFSFLLTVFGVVFSALSFKSKKLRYAAPAVSLGAGVYTLVMALGKVKNFVDCRPLTKITGRSYTDSVLLTAIALIACAAFGIAYLLIDDYLEVAASKGAKRTIPQRVVAFFRDYKSEVKKIVWPSLKDVVKNTAIVLIMCLLIGALIWLIDFGLGQLLELILGA